MKKKHLIWVLIFFSMLSDVTVGKQITPIRVLGGKVFTLFTIKVGTKPDNLGVINEGDMLLGPKVFMLQNDGSIIFLDTENNLLKRFSETGKLLVAFEPKNEKGESFLKIAGNLVVDEQDNYYFALENKILKFNSEGKLEKKYLDISKITKNKSEEIVGLEKYDEINFKITLFDKEKNKHKFYIFDTAKKEIIKTENVSTSLWQDFWKNKRFTGEGIGIDKNGNYYVLQFKGKDDVIEIYSLEGNKYKIIKTITIKYIDQNIKPFEQTIHQSYAVDQLGRIYLLCGNLKEVIMLRIEPL